MQSRVSSGKTFEAIITAAAAVLNNIMIFTEYSVVDFFCGNTTPNFCNLQIIALFENLTFATTFKYGSLEHAKRSIRWNLTPAIGVCKVTVFTTDCRKRDFLRRLLPDEFKVYCIDQIGCPLIGFLQTRPEYNTKCGKRFGPPGHGAADNDGRCYDCYEIHDACEQCPLRVTINLNLIKKWSEQNCDQVKYYISRLVSQDGEPDNYSGAPITQ